ncbi:MAG: hypothetical protein NC517_05835 [Firmicutes bacterium]|nr:hypothetical protein [Bacillota bacterium]
MREALTDRELAERYLPYLRYDRAEPYRPDAIGYTVHRVDKAHSADAIFRSPSSRLQLDAEPGETVIEYAYYYDFDIQHLYDLEHVFVRVDRMGGIIGVLGSFHGKFLNDLIEGETEFEGTHVILYVQPGKHAFMPRPHYFQLAPDRDRCCMEYAGRAGLLIAPMFEGRLSTDEAFDRKVEQYIRENHAFVPAWEFTDREPEGRHILMPWEELDRLIVGRITEWKHKILSAEAE